MEYHHQNYPSVLRLQVCLPGWHVVQLARLVLGLGRLAVLLAHSRRIDDQRGCLTFVKPPLRLRYRRGNQREIDLQLYPMDFHKFLTALGDKNLVLLLETRK